MYKIYTDGAVSKNGQEGAYGGYGFVCEQTGYTECGPVMDATNQICELTAVLRACLYAKDMLLSKDIFPPIEVEIRSDSAYIINCYNQHWYWSWQSNGWKNSKKEPVANKELWEAIIPFFNNPQFSFTKVRGHSGDYWNEKADELANKGKATAKRIIEEGGF